MNKLLLLLVALMFASVVLAETVSLTGKPKPHQVCVSSM